MRALRLEGPRLAVVREVDAPVPGPGELLIDIERVGICGTDVELFTGEMTYFGQGVTSYPLQLGHEWSGRVSGVGIGVDASWIGRRVTGDTMLGCGECAVCRAGRQHVCPNRSELGITDGAPGALAEQITLPARFALAIPDGVDAAATAMVEPGGNSLRSVDAAALSPGDELLVLGSGTIGLLAAQFALARGIRVTVAGRRPESLALATRLGVQAVTTIDEVASNPGEYDAVIDATSEAASPSLALNRVRPAGRLVLIGLSEQASTIDTRTMVLRDVTTVGILSASPGLAGAIELFASGAVDPTPLISEVIGLDEVVDRLQGTRGPDAAPGPKVQVEPWR